MNQSPHSAKAGSPDRSCGIGFWGLLGRPASEKGGVMSSTLSGDYRDRAAVSRSPGLRYLAADYQPLLGAPV